MLTVNLSPVLNWLLLLFFSTIVKLPVWRTDNSQTSDHQELSCKSILLPLVILKVPVNKTLGGKTASFMDLLATPVFRSEGPQTPVTAGGAAFSGCALNWVEAGKEILSHYFYTACILRELYLAFFLWSCSVTLLWNIHNSSLIE